MKKIWYLLLAAFIFTGCAGPLYVATGYPIMAEATQMETERLQNARAQGDYSVIEPRVAILGERAQIVYTGLVINNEDEEATVEIRGPIAVITKIPPQSSQKIRIPAGRYLFTSYVNGCRRSSEYATIDHLRGDVLISDLVSGNKDTVVVDWAFRVPPW